MRRWRWRYIARPGEMPRSPDAGSASVASFFVSRIDTLVDSRDR